MAGDHQPELRVDDSSHRDDNAAAAKQKLAADAQQSALKGSHVTLTSSNLLQPESSPCLSVNAREGIANFVGTASAGVAGTLAWSLADKALGNTRYGLAAKLATSFIVGGGTRFATKGTTELALLDAKDRTTGLSDLAWGGVDALAAVGAVKAEEAFSNSWKASLGRSSGSHLTQEILQEQGKKILEGNLGQRIYHNTLRGVVGGGTGALLWSTPHEVANNFDKLNTLDGWKKTGGDIATSTLFGSAFGGVLMGGSTAVWNARELAGMTKAAVLGKQGRYSLDVYHFNDGHSSVLGERSTLAQLAGKTEELRAASQKGGTSSAVLDLGDMHSGNAAAVVSNTGQLEQRIIQENLQVTASVPGNHVADTGLYKGVTKDVPQWIKNMTEINQGLNAGGREVPGVAANVQSILEPQFVSESGIYKPFRIFVDPKTGDKVGLVGLVTDQLQTATPKLLDSDLAVSAAKFGNFSIKELAERAASDPSGKALLEKLAGTAKSTGKVTGDLVQQLVASNPEAKVSSIVDSMLIKPNVQGLSSEAEQNFKILFTLAGEHPETKLGQLAPQLSGNKALSDLAALYPDKRIADLHQVMVSDPVKALQDSIASLKTQGVDKVVVLSHMGKGADLQLAQSGPRVAAILGGHSHDLEPLPIFVKNQSTGSDVLVSQAGHSYGWLGEANLVFNKDGSLNRFLSSGKMHVIDESVAPMKSAQDAVLKHMESSAAGRTLLQQVGERHPVQVSTEITLDNIRGQQGTQTPLANLLVNAFKVGGDSVLPEVNATRIAQGLPALGDSVDAVLIQSGGIRTGLPAGPLDELTLQTMFMNKPALVEMSGAEIQKTLSYGMHDFPTAPSSFADKTMAFFKSFGRDSSPLAYYDASGKNVIAGQIRFNVDRALPTYGRVASAEIWDNATGNFVPLDPAKRYTVMTVSHLLGRIGNTPLIPAAQLRGTALNELGPEYWALGQRMENAAVNAAMKPSELPAESSRNFLLDFLKANSKDGQFVLPKSLLQSPMRDISAGTWVPELRPSVASASAIGAVAADSSAKRNTASK